MTLNFDVTQNEYAIIRDILQRVLPSDAQVWVFGSRAKGTARFNSDLDLALQGKTALSQETLYILKDALSEAPLPYRVDVVDLAQTDPSFQTIIAQHRVAFYATPHSEVKL
jgi:predicted nucleotidyltransferase